MPKHRRRRPNCRSHPISDIVETRPSGRPGRDRVPEPSTSTPASGADRGYWAIVALAPRVGPTSGRHCGCPEHGALRLELLIPPVIGKQGCNYSIPRRCSRRGLCFHVETCRPQKVYSRTQPGSKLLTEFATGRSRARYPNALAGRLTPGPITDPIRADGRPVSRV